MDLIELNRQLDDFKDTYVENYGAYKLKSGVPQQVIKSAIGSDLIRNYYGLLYYSPDKSWSRQKWNPSLSERFFFFKHRFLAKILGGSHVYSEADQVRLWTIRGGENYSFESEAGESKSYAVSFFEGLFSEIPLDKNASVLELGCGSGRNLNVLREMGFTNLKGVDFSESQVKFCIEYGIDAQLMNIAELSFPDDSFDFVYTNSVLLHVPPDRINDVLTQAIRVSRKVAAFREKSYETDSRSGHVNKYNYYKLLDSLGYTSESVGEFILVRKQKT